MRFDKFQSEAGREGNETVQDKWTGGIKFVPTSKIRLQLNYILKKTEYVFGPNLDDDILFLSFQFFFDSDISR